MKDDVVRTRVTSEFRKQLEKVAEKENRTMSNLLESALKEYLKNHGYTSSKEEK